jgi:hypothetical protein
VVKLTRPFLHYNTVFVCWIEEVREGFGGGVVLEADLQHIDLSRFVIRRIVDFINSTTFLNLT